MSIEDKKLNMNQLLFGSSPKDEYTQVTKTSLFVDLFPIISLLILCIAIWTELILVKNNLNKDCKGKMSIYISVMTYILAIISSLCLLYIIILISYRNVKILKTDCRWLSGKKMGLAFGFLSIGVFMTFFILGSLMKSNESNCGDISSQLNNMLITSGVGVGFYLFYSLYVWKVRENC